jgi:hypothetical protein
MTQLAAGTHALIRDKKWLICLVDPYAEGGWLFACYGISELVRGAIGDVSHCTRSRYRNTRSGPNLADVQRQPQIQRCDTLFGESAQLKYAYRYAHRPRLPGSDECCALPTRPSHTTAQHQRARELTKGLALLNVQTDHVVKTASIY